MPVTVNVDWREFDKFFLTRFLATGTLREDVYALKAKLETAAAEFENLVRTLIDVQEDLASMGQKAEFVNAELLKTAAVMTPPPDGDVLAIYDFMEENVHTPAFTAELGVTGLGGLSWLVGRIGVARINAITNSGKISKIASTAKSAKWTKAMKFGKKLGKIGLAIALVDLIIKAGAAGKMNDKFKAESEKLKEHLEEAEKEIADAKDDLDVAEKIFQDMLDSVGAADLLDYKRIMGEALFTIGVEKGQLTSARRMLLDGVSKKQIKSWVAALSATAIDSLETKLEAEKAFLAGKSLDDVMTKTGLDRAMANGVRLLQEARLDLVKGLPVQDIAEQLGIAFELVDGENDILETDLELYWDDILDTDKLVEVAARLLVSDDALRALRLELMAGERLVAGAAASAIAADLGLPEDKVSAWKETLAQKSDEISLAKARAEDDDAKVGLAVDYRMTLSALAAV